MARGLPFIYAHDDPHMSEEMAWCLKVPNDDTLINMNDVDSFVQRTKGIDGLSGEMREYAKTNMSWESQFEKVFQKLKSIDRL